MPLLTMSTEFGWIAYVLRPSWLQRTSQQAGMPVDTKAIANSTDRIQPNSVDKASTQGCEPWAANWTGLLARGQFGATESSARSRVPSPYALVSARGPCWRAVLRRLTPGTQIGTDRWLENHSRIWSFNLREILSSVAPLRELFLSPLNL